MTRTLISNSEVPSSAKTIKFLYSYGGKILPRRTDGKLRYVGGFTRVLAVYRSITFAELMVKFGELSGSSMSLKCKLPNEDLDVLVSITSDEDLANLIDEYDRFSSATHKDMKITAVLFPLKSLKKISPVSSAEDLCSAGSSVGSPAATSPPLTATTSCRCGSRIPSPVFNLPVSVQRDAGKGRCTFRHQYRCRGGASPRHTYFVPHSNYCR